VVEKDGNFFVQESLLAMEITPYESFISRNTGKFVLMRLKQADTILTPQVLADMNTVFQSFADKKYDLWFKWSDEHIYCSELVYKIYERGAKVELMPLKQVKDYNLDSNEVQSIIKKRFGSKIDLEEPVIAPSDLMTSPILEVVFER
jgi:hypothetical protein